MAPPAEHECVAGLWLTDEGVRRKSCHRCATHAQKARVEAVQKAAHDLKILRGATMSGAWRGAGWPYGPNIDLDSREALVAWAEPRGLRASSTRRGCLHWLQQVPCPRDRSGMCAERLPGADHVSAWNLGAGKNPAALVSQPYKLDAESRGLLAEINESPGLWVEIDDMGGWYGHETVFVAVWRTDPLSAPPRNDSLDRNPQSRNGGQPSQKAKLRLTCCMCRKPIPLRSDAYALDSEWQRRYPDMVGALACPRCALETYWSCQGRGGRAYVDGHIPAIRDGRAIRNCDAWDHVDPRYGTQAAMVRTHPWSGLLQGAEAYLRKTVARHRSRPAQDPGVIAALEEALDRWDARSRP